MAQKTITFTVKELEEDVLNGVADELGWDSSGEETIDAFFQRAFKENFCQRHMKPALERYMTRQETAALDAVKDAVEATEINIETIIS